jgi:hypothetical protein
VLLSLAIVSAPQTILSIAQMIIFRTTKTLWLTPATAPARNMIIRELETVVSGIEMIANDA